MLNVILIITVISLVFMSALFSGAETGLYQMNLLRLRLGMERKKLSFILLGKLFDDTPSLLISTLLGTDLAQYTITSIITFMFMSKYNNEFLSEIFATIVTTPLLFIFSDLIPKNLFFNRADYFMPFVSYVLYAVNKLFNWLGIVPVLRAMLKFFAGSAATAPFLKAHANVFRFPYLKKIIYDIETQNLLSPVQTSIVNRLSQIGNLTAAAVMTALAKVRMLDINSQKDILIKQLKEYPFTFWPVCDKSNENIIGFVNVLDYLSEENPSVKLSDFLKPLGKLNEQTTIIDAIKIMQAKNQKLMLVVKKGHGDSEKPVGIITMKDLAEELVGEISEW